MMEPPHLQVMFPSSPEPSRAMKGNSPTFVSIPPLMQSPSSHYGTITVTRCVLMLIAAYIS